MAISFPGSLGLNNALASSTSTSAERRATQSAHPALRIAPPPPRIVNVQIDSTRLNLAPQHQGQRIEEISRLLDRLSSNVGGFASSSVGDILSELSRLSPETQSFYDASQSAFRTTTEDAEGNRSTPPLNFDADLIGSPRSNFSLQIETRDGDRVSIDLAYLLPADSHQAQTTASLSYQVEGELDEAEFQAVHSLAAALGAASDAGFYGDESFVQLDGLSAFDPEQLAGFDLELNTVAESSAGFSFDIDLETQTQTLSGFQDQYGNTDDGRLEYSVELDLNTPFAGTDFRNNAQYRQYLDLIEQASNNATIPHLTDGVNAFFRSGLEASFATAQRIAEQRPGQPPANPPPSSSAGTTASTRLNAASLGVLNNDTALALSSGFNQPQGAAASELVSGLADITASFGTRNFDQTHNSQFNETTGFRLDLAQETEQSTQVVNGQSIASVTQRNDYNLELRRFLDFTDSENYNYQTLQATESLIRSATLDQSGALLDASLRQRAEATVTDTQVEEGRRVSRNQTERGLLQSSNTLDPTQIRQGIATQQLNLYQVIDELL